MSSIIDREDTYFSENPGKIHFFSRGIDCISVEMQFHSQTGVGLGMFQLFYSRFIEGEFQPLIKKNSYRR